MIKTVIRHFNSSNVLLNTSFAPKTTTSGAGRAENITIPATFTLQTGDYLEIYGANTTAIVDITATDALMDCALA